MVEVLDSSPRLGDARLVSAYQYARDDQVHERGNHLHVVIDGDLDYFIGVAREVRVDSDLVIAPVILVVGIGKGKAVEALKSGGDNGSTTWNVGAVSVAVLIAGDGEAQALAGGITDANLGLDEAGHIYDAENKEKKKGRDERELYEALSFMMWGIMDIGGYEGFSAFY